MYMRIIILLLFLANISFAGRIIQLKDFLCGCEYCVTVPTQEPLDIGRHMIMCHSSREATLKTLAIMEATKKPKLEDKNTSEIIANKSIKKTKIANEKNPNK